MKITHTNELIGKRVVVTALLHPYVDTRQSGRRLGAVGVVTEVIPYSSGDYVWVAHENEKVTAPYCHLDELEFYSERAAAFAVKKAEMIENAEALTKRLRELPYGG